MSTTQAVQKQDWRGRGTVTVEEAAPILGIGRSTAYVLARTGELPTLRLGRRYVVPTAALKRMLGETLINEDSAPAANQDAVEKLAGGDGHHEDYAR